MDHIKEKIVLETWNIQTLNKYGQLETIKLEMNKLNVSILGVCKTNWANNGDFISDRHSVIYAERERERWEESKTNTQARHEEIVNYLTGFLNWKRNLLIYLL